MTTQYEEDTLELLKELHEYNGHLVTAKGQLDQLRKRKVQLNRQLTLTVEQVIAGERPQADASTIKEIDTFIQRTLYSIENFTKDIEGIEAKLLRRKTSELKRLHQIEVSSYNDAARDLVASANRLIQLAGAMSTLDPKIDYGSTLKKNSLLRLKIPSYRSIYRSDLHPYYGGEDENYIITENILNWDAHYNAIKSILSELEVDVTDYYTEEYFA